MTVRDVMAHHRQPEPEPPPARRVPPAALLLSAITRLSVILSAGNTLVGLDLIFVNPGVSPALAFLKSVAPLPVFGVGFVLVAALLLTAGHKRVRLHVAGHFLAVVLWLMFASGASLGVVFRSSTAPAASISLALLTIMTAAFHVNGLLFRRRISQFEDGQ